MKSSALPFLLLTAAGMVFSTARAQIKITGIGYGALTDLSDVNNQGAGSLDFDSQYRPVNTVTTGIGSYRFDGPTATSIVTRRNTGEAGPDNTTVFYQTPAANSAAPLGQYESSVENMFLSGNLLEGLRNPFANGAGSENSNIERIDFRLPNYVVQANDALVFFDLENGGNFGDGFRIAAYTSVNGVTGAPTAYAGNGLLVAADSFGPAVSSPVGGTNGNFERVTYTDGDDLSGGASDITNIGNDLNLVGIMIRFSDLGIAAGTTIQGFSLMGADVSVSASSGADLLDWNNTSHYHTNTSPTGVGNMDFMGFGATIARPVPEPSTYGAILVGTVLCGWLWRRRSSNNAAAKA